MSKDNTFRDRKKGKTGGDGSQYGRQTDIVLICIGAETKTRDERCSACSIPL